MFFNYQSLNEVVKADLDVHPLLRIDDLLDKLGKAKYFSTLDLATGYWQIKVQSDSPEKDYIYHISGLI